MTCAPRSLSVSTGVAEDLRTGLPPGVPQRTPWHPGRFLSRNYLAPLGLTQTDAARLLGVSRRRLHELVQGQRSMTPDTAIRCALVFGPDAAFWLTLQAAWDSFHAWKLLRSMPHKLSDTATAPGVFTALGPI